MTNEQAVTVERAKQQLRERYWKETGEELPDHVLENLDLLTFDPGMVGDISRNYRMAEQRHEPGKARIAAAAIGVGFVVGGLVIGAAAATFATAMAATVAFGVGFTLAGIVML